MLIVKLRFSRRAPSLVSIFEEQFVQLISEGKKHLTKHLTLVTKTLCKKENHLIKAEEKIEKKHII